MNILKFLATPTFNWLDIVILAFAGSFIARGQIVIGVIICIVGSSINIIFQRTVGVLNEKPKS